MPKKKKLSEQELEQIHQEFSQSLADEIYESAEVIGHEFHKKYNYDSTISVFNVLLSMSANYAIELGMPAEDFVEVCKEFWQNANQMLSNQEMATEPNSDWLEPKAKTKKELS
jgi:hypothetical protein